MEMRASYEELKAITEGPGPWQWEGFDICLRFDEATNLVSPVVGDCEVRPGQTCVIRGGKPTAQPWRQDAAGQDPQPREVLERVVDLETRLDGTDAETCRLARDLITRLAARDVWQEVAQALRDAADDMESEL